MPWILRIVTIINGELLLVRNDYYWIIIICK
nr:MAG TPA: hypothetical protein [Caudoviricetes sp.]